MFSYKSNIKFIINLDKFNKYILKMICNKTPESLFKHNHYLTINTLSKRSVFSFFERFYY